MGTWMHFINWIYNCGSIYAHTQWVEFQRYNEIMCSSSIFLTASLQLSQVLSHLFIIRKRMKSHSRIRSSRLENQTKKYWRCDNKSNDIKCEINPLTSIPNHYIITPLSLKSQINLSFWVRFNDMSVHNLMSNIKTDCIANRWIKSVSPLEKHLSFGEPPSQQSNLYTLKNMTRGERRWKRSRW